MWQQVKHPAFSRLPGTLVPSFPGPLRATFETEGNKHSRSPLSALAEVNTQIDQWGKICSLPACGAS